jgi:ribosomal protein L34
MTKRTLSNKSRYSILKLSGFRVRMKTADGRKIINKRRKKQRNRIALTKSK